MTADGTPRDEHTLLYVGRVSREKGLETLIEALPLITREFPQMRVKFAGREDKPGLISTLTERLRAAGLGPSAVEFSGPLDREALPRTYRGSSACVLPTRFSSGYTCLEAMASGCAVVAGVSPRGHRMITDGYDGVLVPEDRPEAFAAAIRRVFANPRLRQELGQRAMITVKERFSSALIGAATVDLYHRAMMLR